MRVSEGFEPGRGAVYSGCLALRGYPTSAGAFASFADGQDVQVCVFIAGFSLIARAIPRYL